MYIIGVPQEEGQFGRNRMGSNDAEGTSTVTTREPVLEGEVGAGRLQHLLLNTYYLLLTTYYLLLTTYVLLIYYLL